MKSLGVCGILGCLLVCFTCIGSVQSSILCRNLTDDEDVSEVCKDEYNTACHAFKQGELWAAVMFDSNGKRESGKFYGDLVYLGNYQQCMDLPEQQISLPVHPIQANLKFCTAFWQYAFGHGMCVPGSCSIEDFVVILQSEFNRPGLRNITMDPSAYTSCVEDKSMAGDAGAIITIAIIALFVVIVFAATLYDNLQTRQERLIHPEQHEAKEKLNCSDETELSNGRRSRSPRNVGHIEKTAVECDDEASAGSGSENNSYNEGSGSENKSYKEDSHMTASRDREEAVELDAAELDAAEKPPNGALHRTGLQRVDTKKIEQAQSHEPGSRSRTHANRRLVRVLLSFSLLKNVPKLLSSRQSDQTFACLNGIRVLSMAGVLFGHTYSFVNYTTTSNLFQFLFWYRQFWFQAVYQLTLTVDAFFVLSGFLVSYAFLKGMRPPSGLSSKSQMVTYYSKRMGLYYFHRYWRLTPILAIILLIYANLTLYMARGPFESDPVFTVDFLQCSQYWYRVIFYINNLNPTMENQCFGVTWYLANDFQFYVILPVFVAPLVWAEHLRRTKREETSQIVLVCGLVWVGLAVCGSLISTIYLYHDLHTGGYVNEGFDIYLTPWCRSSVYFMAVYLGFIVYRTNGKVRLHPIVLSVGWVTTGLILLVVFYLPYLESPLCTSGVCGDWTPAGRTVFDALFRPVFALGLMWIMFACITGYGGFINTILSWNFWTPLARLTYVGYLIHGMILVVYSLSLPVQTYVSNGYLFFMFFGLVVITFGVSFVLSVIIEAPLMAVEKTLLPKRS